jgi:hypothetical protein
MALLKGTNSLSDRAEADEGYGGAAAARDCAALQPAARHEMASGGGSVGDQPGGGRVQVLA